MKKPAKSSKSLIQRLSYGLLVFVMLATVSILLVPRLFGCQCEAILSGSMSPALKAGDLAIVLPVNPYTIQIGDVVAYHPPSDPDILVVHRVIAINPSNSLSFLTKGDANPSADGYSLPAQNVTGKVRFHFPWLGYFTGFAQSTLGFVFLLAIPGAVIIYGEMNKLWDAFSPKRTTRRKSRARAYSAVFARPLNRASFASSKLATQPSGLPGAKYAVQYSAGRGYKPGDRPLSRPTNSTPQFPGGREGLVFMIIILPGKLDGIQFKTGIDAQGNVSTLDYGKVRPGYSRLGGDTLRIRNLGDTALQIAAVLTGDVSRFCHDIHFHMGANPARQRSRQGNPLTLPQGKEAALKITLRVPLNIEASGSHRGTLLISGNGGAIEKRIETFITIISP